jgi:hypothetical protein
VQRGEMTQTMYAHVNEWIIIFFKNRILKEKKEKILDVFTVKKWHMFEEIDIFNLIWAL